MRSSLRNQEKKDIGELHVNGFFISISHPLMQDLISKKNTKYSNIQSNLNSSNTDGSFTMDNSNLILSPYEILPIDQENQYLRKLFYFIMKLYVGCAH